MYCQSHPPPDDFEDLDQQQSVMQHERADFLKKLLNLNGTPYR